MSKLSFSPAIPVGETVLVSGVTGYIAAQIAENLLAFGYRVRGTSRNPNKAQNLLQQFNQKYGTDKFEIVKVENVNAEGAFSEAAKGVAGIIHVALDSNLTGEPEPYIANTVEGSLNVLRTAKADPQIKRVVFTASSMGAVPWKTGVEYSFGVDAYNEDSIKKAYEPPFTPDKAFTVYGASKALAEKAIFKWLAEEKPNFVYNAVLPAVNFGFSASGPFGSTGGWAKAVSEGDWSTAQYVSPQFFVDINDTALIHVGALLHPDVESERLFAFAEPQNWNTVLAKLRELYPQQSFADDFPNLGHDLSHPPNDRALFVLKSLGAPGWKSLEQSLKEAFDTLYA